MRNRVIVWLSASAVSLFVSGCIMRGVAEEPMPIVGPQYGVAPASQMVGEPSPYEVSSMPPDPLYEQMSDSPGDGSVWIDGYWHWNGDEWVWVGGRWEREQDGYAYVAPYYAYDGGSYIYTPGYWRNQRSVPAGWVTSNGGNGRPPVVHPPVGWKPNPQPSRGGGVVTGANGGGHGGGSRPVGYQPVGGGRYPTGANAPPTERGGSPLYPGGGERYPSGPNAYRPSQGGAGQPVVTSRPEPSAPAEYQPPVREPGSQRSGPIETTHPVYQGPPPPQSQYPTGGSREPTGPAPSAPPQQGAYRPSAPSAPPQQSYAPQRQAPPQQPSAPPPAQHQGSAPAGAHRK